METCIAKQPRARHTVLPTAHAATNHVNGTALPNRFHSSVCLAGSGVSTRSDHSCCSNGSSSFRNCDMRWCSAAASTALVPLSWRRQLSRCGRKRARKKRDSGFTSLRDTSMRATCSAENLARDPSTMLRTSWRTLDRFRYLQLTTAEATSYARTQRPVWLCCAPDARLELFRHCT